MHDGIANRLRVLLCLAMNAGLIVKAKKHSDWNLADATLVDQSSLALSLQVPGGILLEPIRVCALDPV